jgi:IS5 family transposase
MHQTKKGKQWYFGMKAHVGVDSKTKMIHSVVATAANVAAHALVNLFLVRKTLLYTAA